MRRRPPSRALERAPPGTSRAGVPLARALSKLGVRSRSDARALVAGGRVKVNGRIVRRADTRVSPERDRIEVDDTSAVRAPWRTVMLHKPRGVITTRRDPQGRPTVFDLVPDDMRSLVTVGRLDLATTGLLLLTSDTRLADWLTDPRHGVPRTYRVTVRGRLDDADVARLCGGVNDRGERLQAKEVHLRKSSERESHALVVLTEGKNREVRRLFEAVRHEVTSLARVRFGGLTLGTLPSGQWRELTVEDVRQAFPAAPVSRMPRGPAAREPSGA
jgi:23S rRNA pseudouridine2605 synthase